MNNSDRFDLPLTLPVKQVKYESNMTVTISFEIPSNYNIKPNPGQYFMLWIPEMDEIPISVSNWNNNIISFTICKTGDTTEEFQRIKTNQLIGLRGPFGNGFEIIDNKNLIIIAGGMGIAPLRFLLNRLLNISSYKRILLIQGAKTREKLIFFNEFVTLPIKKYYCTDDGSYEYKGFPTNVLKEILQKFRNNISEWEIFTCGPELMMAEVLRIVDEYGVSKNAQFSLADRYIRCGFGLCGSCYLDDIGLSICKDGPIFRGDILKKINDFGKYGRRADGSKYSFI